MGTTWISGLLKDFFGLKADTANWEASKELMEQSIGHVKIDIPPHCGPIRAFFEQQTLVGDHSHTRSMRYTHTLTCLDLNEAVGKGRTEAEAVVALWNKMTKLSPHENILRLDRIVSDGDAHGFYTEFAFENGAFVNKGQKTYAQPPARPDFIYHFFDNERKTSFVRQGETPAPKA